jgi:hypothetical protein
MPVSPFDIRTSFEQPVWDGKTLTVRFHSKLNECQSRGGLIEVFPTNRESQQVKAVLSLIGESDAVFQGATVGTVMIQVHDKLCEHWNA